jgi:UDP-N-acetylmuramate dehydrogenase
MKRPPFQDYAEHVPLAPFTTWRIGGPARFLVKPDRQTLPRWLAWARSSRMPVWVIGRGSNILVADAGLPGLVLLLRDSFNELTYHPEHAEFVAGAGVSLPRLATFAARHAVAGYEFLGGIPGTVGGAAVMNAGFKKNDPRVFAALCTHVSVCEYDGTVSEIKYADCDPCHRSTLLLRANQRPSACTRPPRIVLGARLRAQPGGNPLAIREEARRLTTMRRETQPLDKPTAGSVFRATADGTPAAVLIDQCGLKGHRCGGAVVSPLHANWIENAGNASACNVLHLICQIQHAVRLKFGVELVPEIQCLGEFPCGDPAAL